jgi:hypothetical protein
MEALHILKFLLITVHFLVPLIAKAEKRNRKY